RDPSPGTGRAGALHDHGSFPARTPPTSRWHRESAGVLAAHHAPGDPPAGEVGFGQRGVKEHPQGSLYFFPPSPPAGVESCVSTSSAVSRSCASASLANARTASRASRAAGPISPSASRAASRTSASLSFSALARSGTAASAAAPNVPSVAAAAARTSAD